MVIAIVSKVIESIDAITRYIRIFLFPVRINSSYLNNLHSPERCLSRLLQMNTSKDVDSVSIAAGNFRIFEAGKVHLGSSPDWHTDFGSGYRYPKFPYPFVNFRKVQGSDCKVPWELSRFQFLPTLLSSTRHEDLCEAMGLAKHWIEQNSYARGINWCSGMEIGLRGLNFVFLLARPELPKAFTKELAKVIYYHSDLLFHMELENPKKRHNHYLVSSVSLLIMLLVFRDDRLNKRIKYVSEELQVEILHQFREDGFNFESSTNYHRFTLEALLLLFAVLASMEVNDMPPALRHLFFNKEVRDRIAKACGLVKLYMSSFAESPQIGDQDDGRVFFYKDYFLWDPLDHSYIEQMYNVVFSAEVELPNESARGMTIFKKSGLVFVDQQEYKMLVYSTPVDSVAGGHFHNDKACIILHAKTVPILVESGTGFYTSDPGARELLRSTQAHNTISIDGNEQNQYIHERVFTVPAPIQTEIGISYEDGCIVSSHSGYSRIKSVEGYKRHILPSKNEIQFNEVFSGTGRHLVKAQFILGVEIQPVVISASCVELRYRDRVICMLLCSNSTRFDIQQIPISRRYSSIQQTNRIQFERELEFPASMEYTFRIVN